MKRYGTRAETRFGLSAKRTSPFKLAGASVQSTTGSRGVCISGSDGSTAQLKPDGTRWRKVGEVKGQHANGVGSQYSSHYLGTWCIQHYYR